MAEPEVQASTAEERLANIEKQLKIVDPNLTLENVPTQLSNALGEMKEKQAQAAAYKQRTERFDNVLTRMENDPTFAHQVNSLGSNESSIFDPVPTPQPVAGMSMDEINELKQQTQALRQRLDNQEVEKAYSRIEKDYLGGQPMDANTRTMVELEMNRQKSSNPELIFLALKGRGLIEQAANQAREEGAKAERERVGKSVPGVGVTASPSASVPIHEMPKEQQAQATIDMIAEEMAKAKQ